MFAFDVIGLVSSVPIS